MLLERCFPSFRRDLLDVLAPHCFCFGHDLPSLVEDEDSQLDEDLSGSISDPKVAVSESIYETVARREKGGGEEVKMPLLLIREEGRDGQRQDSYLWRKRECPSIQMQEIS